MNRLFALTCMLICSAGILSAQTNLKLKYKNSSVYAGIEVGSKGVKLSILEIGNNAKTSGAFNVLADTSINSDFISFTQSSFTATINGLTHLYALALNRYQVSADRIFTVVSSGVKVQAEKSEKTDWIRNLADSFRLRINDAGRELEVIDAMQEARLSHLGIVPDSRRYTTFLIDIGSGNTKGGYFPNGNTSDLRLFELTWGTKSTMNAAEKRLDSDKSLDNYQKQLLRVLAGPADGEVIYAVNASGAYKMSDYIAFSGGIAWAVASLMYPEMMDNSVVPVTYPELVKFLETVMMDHPSLSEKVLAKSLTDPAADRGAVAKEIKLVHRVFDQRALMAGTGLLLKIMRQFEGIYEKKQFYLVKSGHVGWISAYVDQSVAKKVAGN